MADSAPLMDLTISVTGWGALDFPSDVIAAIVEQLSPKQEQLRFDMARRVPPSIPDGLDYFGLGGADISAFLMEVLACPMVERVNSVVLVPFSICAFNDPYEAFEHEAMLSDTGSIHS